MTEYEKKPISPITITGGMLFSVLSMVVCSFFGAAGTLYGAALGSCVSAIGGTVYENAARKTHAKIKARKEQEQADAHPEKHLIQARLASEPLGREALIRAREKRIMLRERNPWRTAGIGAAMMAGCFALAVVTLFTIESATGKTLHSSLTGKAQYGTSFSYSTKSPPAPAVTPALPFSSSPVPSSSSPAATISANPDPDAVPVPASGGAPSSGSMSPPPSVTASATPVSTSTDTSVP